MNEYFQALFQTAGTRKMEAVLEVISPMITKEMNRNLLQPVTQEEAYKAPMQDIQESNHLMDILRRFSMASGQLINLKKSGIIFSGNTQEDKRTEICQNLQMSPLPLNWDSQLFVADQMHKHSTTLWSES
ncbi:unnamed protein product [Ilex paraguariensis]|uniref:Uncharacterized protein n=1 Tax=Ilex paraguariensis TaxID=185542 RepID=A0ABC8SHY7_9AQUA